MTIQDIFIANLKDYRKLRKISQMQLAGKCDSSQTYIAEIEVGKKFPSLDMIEKIANALDIESYYLFKNEPLEAMPTDKRLSQTQKRTMADKIHAAVSKIISDY
ncbi:MAG: hypothetical protein Ta2A_19020 [Treponemataceae bacterium]|nr:MAG: hypothetical protein Ta2A_19020 [Treponemataceae bacterium]